MLEVGVREFRAKLPQYLSDADKAVAITKHGQILGYFIPTKRQTASNAQVAALREATSRLSTLLNELDMSEEDVAQDFNRWRKADCEAKHAQAKQVSPEGKTAKQDTNE